MLQSVDVGERSLEAYRGVAPDAILAELRRVAAELRGMRVLHLNATPYGGGVSELLRSLVPLLNDLGLVADWKVIHGNNAFFEVTKTMHNGLQGAARELSEEEQTIYLVNAEQNAAQLEEEYDFVFIHDPQPAALPTLHGKGEAQWIWRCHIDTSEPNPQVWEVLRPFLAAYDAAIFTMASFVPPDLPVARVEIIPPAIDPLSPKNFPLSKRLAAQVLDWIGISLDRPLITQVARFDPWKDPLGLIAAYRLVREAVPNLQLALVGSMALDDPEGWEVYQKIKLESKGDPSIHLFTNLTGVGNIEVNAFQRLFDVVVQKSIREGFGLVVSEALWKGTPVVAGRVGGIPLQMSDGVGGILVEGVEECAQAILRLLEDPAGADELAQRGKERVWKQFLLPRLLLNQLSLMRELAAGRPSVRRGSWEPRRDPVCGMMVAEASPPSSATFGDRSYFFCSEACRARFLAEPEHYLGESGHGH
ncbi:MAG TPA: glycosyltransferase [Candidatus Fraserbacteria bacterium]|nr:glycosyltransferase [Candidatus Fraserbacteria bacterium]